MDLFVVRLSATTDGEGGEACVLLGSRTFFLTPPTSRPYRVNTNRDLLSPEQHLPCGAGNTLAWTLQPSSSHPTEVPTLETVFHFLKITQEKLRPGYSHSRLATCDFPPEDGAGATSPPIRGGRKGLLATGHGPLGPHCRMTSQSSCCSSPVVRLDQACHVGPCGQGHPRGSCDIRSGRTPDTSL